MAWFSYECPDHGQFRKSFKKRERTAECPVCGGQGKAIMKAASIQVVERLDNGAMARRVERLHNIEEIMEERADKHSKTVMEKLGVTDETTD